jgi:hypothetical protein
MRDLHSNLRVLRAITPVAVGTTGAAGGQLSAVLDRRNYDSAEFIINHGTAGVTSDTTTVIIYECSTTDGTFTSVADADLLGLEADAGLPAQATSRTSGVGKNISRKIGYKGAKPYLKIRLYGLGHATGLVSADLLLSNASRAPVASGT